MSSRSTFSKWLAFLGMNQSIPAYDLGVVRICGMSDDTKWSITGSLSAKRQQSRGLIVKMELLIL